MSYLCPFNQAFRVPSHGREVAAMKDGVRRWIALLAGSLFAAALLNGCRSAASNASVPEFPAGSVDWKSLRGGFLITPVGFVDPVIALKSIGPLGVGWPSVDGTDSLGAQYLANRVRIHLIVAVIGPQNGAVRLARAVRQDNIIWKKVVTLVDGSNRELAASPERGDPHDVGALMYDQKAPIDVWDSKPVAGGGSFPGGEDSSGDIGMSLVTLRIDLDAECLDQSYLVSFEPMCKLLHGTWEGLPVTTESRTLELVPRAK